MGAAPIGIPGCPELAFSTPSAESILMVLTHNSSNFDVISCLSSFQFYLEFDSLPLTRLSIMGNKKGKK